MDALLAARLSIIVTHVDIYFPAISFAHRGQRTPIVMGVSATYYSYVQPQQVVITIPTSHKTFRDDIQYTISRKYMGKCIHIQVEFLYSSWNAYFQYCWSTCVLVTQKRVEHDLVSGKLVLT